jgi:hypothetical protein
MRARRGGVKRPRRTRFERLPSHAHVAAKKAWGGYEVRDGGVNVQGDRESSGRGAFYTHRQD